MKPFWMIFVEEGHAPKKIHEDFDQANSEAFRLAKQTGKKTYILQTVAMYDPPPPVLIPIDLKLEDA